VLSEAEVSRKADPVKFKNQLEISKRLDYIKNIEEINKSIYFIRKMLANLVKSISNKNNHKAI